MAAVWDNPTSRQDRQRLGFFWLSVEADNGPVINAALCECEALRFITLKQVSKTSQSNLTLKSPYFSALTVQEALSD